MISSTKKEILKRIWTRFRITILLTSTLIVVSLIILGGVHLTVPHINDTIEHENAKNVIEGTETNRTLYMEAISNVTSSHHISANVWINRSHFSAGSYVIVLHYNGNHSSFFNSSEDVDIGSDNYRYWWTSFQFYSSFDFPNNTIETDEYIIEPQPADTKVTIQLLVATWNGTHYYDFITRNQTLNILYSSWEVEFEQQIHLDAGLYLFTSVLFCIVNVLAFRPREVIDTPTPQTIIYPNTPLYNPTVEILLSRCDHLDRIKYNSRTGASLLMMLGTAIFVWALSFEIITGVIAGLFMGSLFLVSCSFFALIITFSSVKVVIQDNEIGIGLIPETQSEPLYKAQLIQGIKRREIMLKRSGFLSEIGIVEFFVSIMWFLFISFLPNPYYLLQRIGPSTVVFFVWLLALTSAISISFVLFGKKGLSIYYA